MEKSSGPRRNWVKEILPNKWVKESYRVKGKRSDTTRQGDPYIMMALQDITGEIRAKIWSNRFKSCGEFEDGDVVQVSARAELYEGSLQLVVHELVRCDESQVEPSHYPPVLPSSERDPDETIEEIKAIISGLRNGHIAELLQSFLSDEEFVARFKRAPGAEKIHHPYLGGLAEHSLSLVKLALKVADHYPQIDRDLLVAGCVLHDIGKVHELSFDKAFGYTDEGELIHHITLGVELLDRKIASLPGFPKELGVILKHLILSHHGRYEFQSPRLPMTLEALVLHYLEDLDGKVEAVTRHLEEARGKGERWTEKVPGMNRKFFTVSFGEEGLPEDESED